MSFPNNLLHFHLCLICCVYTWHDHRGTCKNANMNTTLHKVYHIFVRHVGKFMGANCHLNCPDKVIYFIRCPNTQATHQYIEDLLSLAEQGVAHITSFLKMDCPSSQWHIARLSTTQAKRCWAIQANIRTLCNAKVGNAKCGIPPPTCKGRRTSFGPWRVWSKGLVFALMTLSIVWVATKRYMLWTCQ